MVESTENTGLESLKSTIYGCPGIGANPGALAIEIQFAKWVQDSLQGNMQRTS